MMSSCKFDEFMVLPYVRISNNVRNRSVVVFQDIRNEVIHWCCGVLWRLLLEKKFLFNSLSINQSSPSRVYFVWKFNKGSSSRSHNIVSLITNMTAYLTFRVFDKSQWSNLFQKRVKIWKFLPGPTSIAAFFAFVWTDGFPWVWSLSYWMFSTISLKHLEEAVFHNNDTFFKNKVF